MGGKFRFLDYFIQYREVSVGKIKGTGEGYRGSAKVTSFHLICKKSKRLEEINKNDGHYNEAKTMSEGIIIIANLLKVLRFIKKRRNMSYSSDNL